MSLIALKDLSLTRGATLFAGLDLSIAKGDRLGLVAANGRGKSSLLRIMAGAEEATTGTLTRARGLVTAFAPQDPPEHLLPLSLYDAVRDALDAEVAETESWRVDILLDDLAVDAGLRGRAVRNLSGGWQRTMLLARAAVIEPALLLLDEPTNHLDLGRIGVLQRFLAALPRDCAVVAASHDRAFLDDVTNRTLFLRPEESADFAQPYSRALQALEERDGARGRRFENDMRKVRALRQQAAKLKNIGINSGSDLLVVKTKQLSDRADRLEEKARPAHQEHSAGAIRLSNSGSHAKALVRIRDTAITTPDDRLLFRTGQLWIEKGDRVALLGANGAGKTRLVERLRAALRRIGPGHPAGGQPEARLVRPGAVAARCLSDSLGGGEADERFRRPAGACVARRCGHRHRRPDRARRASLGRSAGAACDAAPATCAAELLPAGRTDQPPRHRGAGHAGGRADRAGRSLSAGQPRPRLRPGRGDAGLGDRRQATGRSRGSRPRARSADAN